MEEKNNKQIRELATRIYKLDEKVYKASGSSLGRVYAGEKDVCVNNITNLLLNREQGNKMRGELALISNMARSLKDKQVRHDIMKEYNEILKETMDLPTSFGEGDIISAHIAELNLMNLKDRFKEDDHVVICIGRSCGCGGNEIGFALADALHYNFYDVSVMNEVFRQQDGADAPQATTAFEQNLPKGIVATTKDFRKYHGLSKEDVLFFETSRFLCKKAKEENFIVMGRFADAILTNNHIPHISIFITAPRSCRTKRIMSINSHLTALQARKEIDKVDLQHLRTYKYYTGRKWSRAANYDLCINSASYGLQGSVDMILRMLDMEDKNDKGDKADKSKETD